MDVLKAVASDAVSSSITYLLHNLLTMINKFAAVMGSKQSPPPTEPRHSRKTLSVDVPLSQMRLGIKEMGQSSTSGHARTGTNDPSGNLKNMTQYEPENHDSTVIVDDVMLALQNALSKRERQLKQQQSKYSKLEHAFRELQDTSNTEHRLLWAIIDKHLFPYAQRNDLIPRYWTEETVLDVLHSLSRDAANASPLQYQIQILQKEMLAKVDKTHAGPDEQFAKEFRVIVSLIKTLSRTIRLAEIADVAEALGSNFLQENVLRKNWIDRAQKKLLVESWVWSVLIKMVFRTPFTVYGKQCEQLSEVWSNMFLAEHCNKWPTPSSLCETWRYTTAESMLRLVDRDIITSGKAKNEYRELELDVIETRKGVVAAIESGITTIAFTADNLDIVSIVDKAFTLAVQMALERFRLQITYPKVGDKFNKNMMKLIFDPDGEDIDDGLVAYVVNPGLTKWGDTNGKNLEHRYDIIPSLVQLEATTLVQKTEPRGYPNVVTHGYGES
jgi:molecular chaperone GrpE (heat shock protein)